MLLAPPTAGTAPHEDRTRNGRWAMRGLTRTRAYWGPFLLGVMASLVLWGLAQTSLVTSSWLDLVWVVLVLAAFGAASAVAGGPVPAWGGALAGLAGLLVAWVVINVGLGYVGMSEFPTFLGVTALMLGVPYLAGYGLSWVVKRSRSSRSAAASRA